MKVLIYLVRSAIDKRAELFGNYRRISSDCNWFHVAQTFNIQGVAVNRGRGP